MITQEKVKELFEYRDGKLYWRKSKCNKIGTRAGWKQPHREYWRIQPCGKKYREHQLIYLYFHGYIPEEIDHIDDALTDEGIKSNDISNLRPATRSQNLQKKRICGGTSKYRGVRKAINRKTWDAEIGRNGRHIYLGAFVKEEDAAKAYDRAARFIHGEHCATNF